VFLLTALSSLPKTLFSCKLALEEFYRAGGQNDEQ
jgi:hypothetical protein